MLLNSSHNLNGNMILKEYPSLRVPALPPVVYGGKQPHIPYVAPGVRTPNYKDISHAYTMGITPEEVVRRDLIVRQAAMQCQWKAGEVLQAKAAESRKKYGRLTVRGYIRSYLDVHKTDKWPEDDIPLIVTCSSELEGEIVCTADFLCRGNNGGTC
jgi:hypothetical protein